MYINVLVGTLAETGGHCGNTGTWRVPRQAGVRSSGTRQGGPTQPGARAIFGSGVPGSESSYSRLWLPRKKKSFIT